METIVIGAAMILMMGFMLFGGHKLMGGHGAHKDGAKTEAHGAVTNRAEPAASNARQTETQSPAADTTSATEHDPH